MPSQVQPSNCHKVQTSPLSSLPQAKFTLSYSKVFTKMNGKKKKNQTHFKHISSKRKRTIESKQRIDLLQFL